MEPVESVAPKFELQQVVTGDQLPTTLENVNLSPEDKTKVQQLTQEIDINESQFVLQYGVAAQSQIAGFADSTLSEVRAKDSGYVGDVLTDLMFKIKDLNVNSLSEGPSKIPIIGGLINSVQRFIARYQKLSVEIETIIDALDKAKMQLLKDITLLDALYDKNIAYLKDLDLYILAGMIKIKELNEKIIPEFEAKAKASQDPVEAQKFNDLKQLATRFEKKVHDLKLSRMIGIQTIPQIRLIQNNDQVLVEKIQSSLLNTIPLWKNQIVIAITIFRQKKALEMQKEVTDTTNELLLKNSELLKDNTIGVAKESERGIVEIETLKKVNADLISTIEETLKIQAEGKVKRQQAEVELVKIEKELKDKLISLKG